MGDDETAPTQAESLYRLLVAAVPDAILVVTRSGEIAFLNRQAEKQFGYLRSELLGQNISRIIPHGFAETMAVRQLRSVEDRAVQPLGDEIELYGRKFNGETFPIELILSPLGTIEGLIAVAIRDISGRKATEARLLEKVEELNRSNVELDQFAYVASHDLQEPLRMVASYTQLLSRRYKGKLDADADQFIAFAADGASRMQRLIQDLLAYSRIGKSGKELVKTSSGTALKNALANLRGAIEESRAIVTHDELPDVVADETQLIQLFQNLIGNAVKYRDARLPRIHIGAQNCGPRALFSVQDNGFGIDPNYFEHIFGMFQRLHNREKFDGTGIGLAICKKIVERHGGRISVKSEPGKGSCFRFDLTRGEQP